MLPCAALGNTEKADAVSSATGSTDTFSPGELTEYEGQALDSVNNFRENSIAGVQNLDLASYRLQVDGKVSKPLALNLDQIKALPSVKKFVRIDCVEGWSVRVLWEGVPLKTILGSAGVAPEAVTVVFHAADGYTTSLPLVEILGKDMIVAYKANGLPLPAKLGAPLILVAQDKWGYKWARWITEIELSTDKNYRGYWEQNGYSNSGDRNGPQFEP